MWKNALRYLKNGELGFCVGSGGGLYLTDVSYWRRRFHLYLEGHLSCMAGKHSSEHFQCIAIPARPFHKDKWEVCMECHEVVGRTESAVSMARLRLIREITHDQRATAKDFAHFIEEF